MSNSSLTADHWSLGPLSKTVANPLVGIVYQQILFFWHNSPHRVRVSSFLRFLDHTRRATVGRTPLDELSAHHRDLYLITHNTHNRQTLMPPLGFEPTISAGNRPQIYSLDRVATGTGIASNGSCLFWTIGCGKSRHGFLKNTIR
jgi:hypothetical protein